MNVFGERLKQCRHKLHLTQMQLAKEIECANGVVGDIERGARIPSKKMALKLADFFDTEVGYWLNVEEEAAKIDIKIGDDLIEVFEKFKDLGLINSPAEIHTNEKIKKFILNTVENFLTLNEINKEQD